MIIYLFLFLISKLETVQLNQYLLIIIFQAQHTFINIFYNYSFLERVSTLSINKYEINSSKKYEVNKYKLISHLIMKKGVTRSKV